MKNLKYVWLAFGAIALVVVISVAGYAIFYFREKSSAIEQQNKEAARQASFLEPTISLDNISCDVASDAKTQNYSVTIRTLPANIVGKQSKIENDITNFGGTIVSTSQDKIYDRDAGYINSASINATLPLGQTNRLIAQIKYGTVSPDYMENENNYIQDAAAIKQNCQTNLDAIKNFRSAEILYLNQLKNKGFDQAQPSVFPPVPTTMMNSAGTVTDNLMNTRQNASSYKSSIGNILNQINKANINITVKEIPG